MIKSIQRIHTQLKMEKKHEQSKNTTEYIIVVSIGIIKFCFCYFPCCNAFYTINKNHNNLL